MSTFVLKIN